MRIDFRNLFIKLIIGSILIILVVSVADNILRQHDLYIKSNQGNKNNQIQNRHNDVNINKKGITISFVGDILLASRIGRKIDSEGANYPFEKVKDYLSSSDLAVGNLESSIAVTGTPVQGKEYTFRADPKVIGGLKYSGLDILSLANNHVLDFGKEALVETLGHIEDGGLSYIGAGEDIDEAFKPVIVEIKKKKIAVFGASRVIPAVSWYAGENAPGVAGVYNPDRLIEEIKTVKSNVDYIIVYMHWGTEKETVSNKIQRSLARKVIDNGADVVVGTHPHVLQGFEFYKGKIIAYSLGNFIFTNYNNPTMILNIVLDQNVQSAEVVPCMIRSFTPEPTYDENEKQEIFQMLEDRSVNAKIVDGNVFEFNAEN
ncbi:MAG: CapA family protein [Ignavibacteriales bacterium]